MSDQRNGCYDHEPYADTIQVQVGWSDTSTLYRSSKGEMFTRKPLLQDVPNANTLDCQYSKTNNDPKCTGCKWNFKTEFLRSMYGPSYSQ